MGDLDGKRALVTGAGRGIGLAITRRLAAGGARVAAADLDRAVVQEAIADIDGAVALRCDVTSDDEVREMVAATVKAFGGLDVMVNNAGIDLVKPLLETTEQEAMQILDVNVMGVFRGTRAAIPVMVEGGGGSIVNLGSVASVGGAALQSLYCASKGAVARFTECVALEVRDAGIRVNAVCPGGIDTAMWRMIEDEFPKYVDLPMPFEDLLAAKQGRVGRPDEVAEAVAFLASDRATRVSGTLHKVDNAMTASLV